MVKNTITLEDSLQMAKEAGITFPHYTNTDNQIDFPMNDSPLKYTNGNLIDLAEAGEFDVIIHGCNCWNTMGAGIAREIRNRYPMAAQVDDETVKGDYNKLGNYTTAFTGKFLIVNLYTQFNMSRGDDVFEYGAFQLILEKLAFAFPGKRFGLPYIGCGLAGGEQETIVDMIDVFARRIALEGGTVTLVEFG
jgi:O-acetyl-ADP-ribose deacetylase (regulator of RNase III)